MSWAAQKSAPLTKDEEEGLGSRHVRKEICRQRRGQLLHLHKVARVQETSPHHVVDQHDGLAQHHEQVTQE